MPHAIIVGAGIGGLAAANALQRIGWSATVLERASEIGAVGAGISLMPNALRALDQLGLREAVRVEGAPQVSGGLRDVRGRWLMHTDGDAIEAALGSPVVMLHRAQLHQTLLAPLDPASLRTGITVTGVDPDSGTVTYQGGQVTADLVVAADGVASVLRGQLFPAHPEPRHTGVTAWRGVTSAPMTPPPTGCETWAFGAEFGLVAMSDGRVYWYGAVAAPEGQRYDDEMAEVCARFGDWPDPIPAVLDATDPEAVLHHDLYELRPPLPSFVRGRVALLGDAAHAMTPYLGQGAAMGIEDAVVLAACLVGSRDPGPALAAYDRARRPRTQRLVRASRQVGRAIFVPRTLVAARNLAVRLTPERASLRAIARYADWTAPELP